MMPLRVRKRAICSNRDSIVWMSFWVGFHVPLNLGGPGREQGSFAWAASVSGSKTQGLLARTTPPVVFVGNLFNCSWVKTGSTILFFSSVEGTGVGVDLTD